MTATASDTRTDAPSGLLRSNVVVAVGTATSRLTGMLKVIVFGIVIGQTALADAYDGANNSPNAVYELLLGGVLSAALVPMFTRWLEHDDQESTEVVVSVAIVALAALTAVAVLGAPWIFGLFSLNPADTVDVEQYRSVGTALARIFLLQVFFYGVSALLGALLNAHRRFFAAAWAPVLSNLSIICSLLFVPAVLDDEAPVLGDVLDDPALKWLLGLGATAGIALQAMVLLPALHRAGVRLRFRFRPTHPAVRRLLTLSGWTFGYVLANQVAVIVVKNLAEPGSGGQDAYTKALTFFYFPHGLLAMSIATTFVPEMARAVSRRDKAAFISRTSLGIRIVALLTIPASAGLLVLSRPIIGALLQHGQFDEVAATTTSRALIGLSLGLAGFSIYLFVLRGFYAHQDTRTPFVVNLFQNGLNIALAFVLVGRFDVLGLGLSLAISYGVVALWAITILGYKVPGFAVRPLYLGFVRMSVAAAVMAAAVWLVAGQVGANSGPGAVLRIAVGAVVGGATYVGVLLAIRAPELSELRDRIRPRGA